MRRRAEDRRDAATSGGGRGALPEPRATSGGRRGRWLAVACLAAFLVILGSATVGGLTGCMSFTVTVGGYVTRTDGAPVPDVEVVLEWPNRGVGGGGGPVRLFTDDTGWYSYEYGDIFADEQVFVRPSHPDYTFTPESHHLVGVGDGRLDVDFTAIPVPTRPQDPP